MVQVVDIRGLKGLKDKIDRIENSIFSKSLMSEIGLFSMTKIKERTLQGKDADNTTFAPYTPKYAILRQLKGFPINKVDLTRTGSLLSSMTFDPDNKQVDIYFLNTEDPSGGNNPLKAVGLSKKRNFFALSSEDINGIMKIATDYYHKLIES